ncbi:hypothetical protein [Elizabethkingia anophelis]|uniref:hypothetical protein n=1 Tax=Elizabethkingia anophelis TaxID=1117645 RepID=UPI002011654C|nr:hypothetical protein [Elizabethkingia anophelis]MCL1690410.1 hypothetical protein [Elizabethkingia anophelis]
MLITPIELKARIERVKDVIPTLVQNSLVDANLVQLNINNLMQGKDSRGVNMPPYYQPEYAHFKTSINPRNRGFWDLRVTGNYHKNIVVDISPTKVYFHNLLKGPKYTWLENQFEKKGVQPLGLPEKQIKEVQIKNNKDLSKKIIYMINNGL